MYNHGRNIWRFTYLFQHNEFHAWSAANHAKVITGTQITAASRVKMNVSADLPRRLPPESMAQLCHVVADVKLKKQKKKREKRKKKEKRAKKEWKTIQIYIYVRPRIHSKFRFFPILEIYLYFALENWFSSKKKNPCNSNVNFNQSLRIKLIGITIFNRYRELFILRSSNSNDRLYLIFLGLELESFVAPKTENDRNWKELIRIGCHDFQRTMIRVQNNLIRFSIGALRRAPLDSCNLLRAAVTVVQAFLPSSAPSDNLNLFQFHVSVDSSLFSSNKDAGTLFLRDAAHRETVVEENCELSLRPAEVETFMELATLVPSPAR